MAGQAFAQAAERVDRVSTKGFEQTVKQLETALKGHGMMVVATVDYQNMLRMVGANVHGSKTLEFGKPDMMKQVMSAQPDIGLEMPLRTYVYERSDGKTVVSYYKPSAAFGRYTYCMPRFCPPLHDVMCCEYNRFPTRTQHWQGKSRRRKDDTDVGTTARGVVGRLHRVP